MNSSELDHLFDKPISRQSSDRLGFSRLTEALANAIDEHPNSSNLVLGLDGPWGSGKSSILELLQGELRARHNNLGKTGVGLVVIEFSPWLITNRTALITSFFSLLSKAIDRATSRAFPWWNPCTLRYWLKIKKLRTQLHDFSTIVAIASTATIAFDPTMTSAAIVRGSSAIGKITKPNKETLEKRKRDLEDRLGDLAKTNDNFRILVLIDDLDRLDPRDAVEVLRLVKAVADFPAVTYLLAHDRNVLADAIKENRNASDGHAYMEKILQFSFKVPPLEPFRLREWLKDEIEVLFPGEVIFESERAQAVLDVWAGRLLRTPRDVKRLLFAVRSIWKDLESKVDLLDLIWLQMVKEKAASSSTDLYGWVTRYLQSLDAVSRGGMIVGRKEDSTSLSRILSGLGWRIRQAGSDDSDMDVHFLNKILAGITQSFLDDSSNEKVWTHSLSNDNLQEFRESKRLSSPWHWRLYFAHEPPSHAIIDDEWTTLIHAASKSTDHLQHGILTLLQHGTTDWRDLGDQLLDRVTHAAKRGTLNDPKSWLIAVFLSFDRLRKYSKEVPFFTMDKLTDRTFHIMAQAIFAILSDDDRATAIQFIFVEGQNLGLAAEMLRRQYALSKKDSSDAFEGRNLNAEEQKIAIHGQLYLFDQMSTEAFLQSSSPYDILFAWYEITGSTNAPSAFLNNAFSTDEGLLHALDALKQVTSTEQKNVPHVPEGLLSPFVDTISVRARLKSLAASGGNYAAQATELLELWWESK